MHMQSIAGRVQAVDPELGVTVRFRPERSGYLTFHNVEAPPQVPAEHGPRQWLYMIADAQRKGRASSTMWRDEHGRISGPPARPGFAHAVNGMFTCSIYQLDRVALHIH